MISNETPSRFNPVLLALAVIAALLLTWAVTGSLRSTPMDMLADTSEESPATAGSAADAYKTPWYSKWFSRQAADRSPPGKVATIPARANPYYKTPEEHRAAVEAAAPKREQLRENLKKHLGDRYTEQQIDGMTKH